MSEILGHDCNGRPLRAGDEVVLIIAGNLNDPDIGKVCTVMARQSSIRVWIKTQTESPTGINGWWGTLPEALRKINQDHQPAGSFDEVMAGLKSPVRQPDENHNER